MPGHLASGLAGLPFTVAKEIVLSNTLDHGMAIGTSSKLPGSQVQVCPPYHDLYDSLS